MIFIFTKQIYDHIYGNNKNKISELRQEAEMMIDTEMLNLLSFDA